MFGKREDPFAALQAQIDGAEIQILERMEKQGLKNYRRSLVGTVSCLAAAFLVALIAFVGSLNVVFFAFAALLLIASIRYWRNMRDMEHFIDTVRQDLINRQRGGR